MKKVFIVLASALAVCASAFAQETTKPVLKPYGFVRTYFAYDTRECVSGTEDFFTYLPKDKSLLKDGTTDGNNQSSARFASLTSRLGLDVTGFAVNNWKFGAKIEGDFYAGVSGVTGTATFRLRQAYMTAGTEKVNFKVGQAWHPMAADMPDVFSLNTGAPFGPFSRTPQVTFDWNVAKTLAFTVSAIWQMQYCSTGPSKASADYIKYSKIPEFYVGATLKSEGFLGRLGVDILSIKPRNTDGTSKVSDRITTVSPFLYLQYKKDVFAVKFKTVFAQAGEHMNLNGGYGISDKLSDGSYEYTPTRNSSSWLSLSYGRKIQGILFLGYVRNFGTTKDLYKDDVTSYTLYFSKNSFSNMNRMWRITPSAVYNIGKRVALGLEWEITSVQYGDAAKMNSKGLCAENLHWITNNRIQAMAKFTF